MIHIIIVFLHITQEKSVNSVRTLCKPFDLVDTRENKATNKDLQNLSFPTQQLLLETSPKNKQSSLPFSQKITGARISTCTKLLH